MATAFPPPSPPLLTAATPQPPSSSASSSSAMIVIIVIASAVIISASIYLLLRVVSKRFRRSFSTTAADVDVVASSSNRRVAPGDDLLHSLPLFTFRSLNNAGGGGDCAVCLSKFEPRDQLRLLPICCHAFHAACIDKWIASNQTCPLCRSTVSPYACDALDKILRPQNCPNFTSGSFRIELGSVSLRRSEAPPPPAPPAAASRRTYSLGSYDYTVDDCIYEVSAACTTHRREYSDDKEADAAEEASGGRRSWLAEMSMSFRSSGRFFGGSSRRSEAAVAPEDLEANRAGEEISEIFRWISGI